MQELKYAQLDQQLTKNAKNTRDLQDSINEYEKRLRL